MQVALVEGMGLGHSLQNPSGRKSGIFRERDLRKQHDEFIAALPADRVRATHASQKAIRDGLKKLVADGVSQGIIDVLEAV